MAGDRGGAERDRVGELVIERLFPCVMLIVEHFVNHHSHPILIVRGQNQIDMLNEAYF